MAITEVVVPEFVLESLKVTPPPEVTVLPFTDVPENVAPLVTERGILLVEVPSKVAVSAVAVASDVF